MDVTAPEWLTARAGSLQIASDKSTWFVVLNQQAQYALVAVPVAGKFGCSITQTINGKRIDGSGTYGTSDEAICGGLDDLRRALGW